MKKYPQELINLKVKEKKELKRIKGYDKVLKYENSFLGVNSQLVIRYSGTEPLLRIMIEAETSQMIKESGRRLVSFFEKHLEI